MHMFATFPGLGDGMASKLTFHLLLTVIVTGVQSDRQIVSVPTNIGVINGFAENITLFEKTSRINKFLGIPFAEPPIGYLRFKKPVPKSSLKAPLDAFDHNNACVQGYQIPNVTYSEDCLYLNIYAPRRVNPNETLPVMVWIYGGGFQSGEANSYIGDHLSISGDVIVVTFNYRVSIFGFLSTGDDASPGNYGLWDQRLAIKWVHENIDAFGGDPDKVTIFGESAGSTSVIYQGLYAENVGLFQRIIGQSGSISSFWGSTDKGSHYARTVGSIANCSAANSDSMVTCLRELPARQLMDLVAYPPGGVTFPDFTFLPTTDNDFITYDPKKVFESGKRQSRDAVQFFASLDLFTGVNAGEGDIGLIPMYGVADWLNFLPNRTDFENRLVPLLIKEGYGDEFLSVLKEVIISEYTNWTDPGNPYNIRDEYIRMHADFSFNAHLYRTLDAHASVALAKKTYMYYLDIEPETHVFGEIPWFKKAKHGDDVPLVFGYRVLYGEKFPSPREWELEVSEDMMTLWTNFAKTGDPNFPDDLGLDWKSYTTVGHHYLQITRNMTSSNAKQRWNIGAPYFWFDVIPLIIQSSPCEKTYPDTTSSAGPSLLSGIRPSADVYFLLLISTIAVSSFQT